MKNFFQSFSPLSKVFVIFGVFLLLVLFFLKGLLVYLKNYTSPAHKILADAEIVEKQVQVGDVLFNYAEGPDNGPALVLLHAQTLDWFTYHAVLPELSRSFHVFAIDYVGHGKTVVSDDYEMNANQIGEDLAKFIEEVIGESVFVTGNSSGGLLTAWLAANHPEIVRGIVVEDPPLFSSEYPEIQNTVADKLFTMSDVAVNDLKFNGNFLDYWLVNGTAFFKKYTGPFSQEIITFVVNAYRNANPGEAVEIAFVPVSVQEMLRGLNYYDLQFGAAFHRGDWNEGFDHAEALKIIECPTLLIQANFGYLEDGTLDGAMSQEMADKAVAFLHNGSYIKVDAGHVTNLENPEEFVAILKEFFLGE